MMNTETIFRKGSFNRLVSAADVLGHAVRRGTLDYERTPVRQATLDELDEQKIKDFRAQRLRTSVPDLILQYFGVSVAREEVAT